MLRHLRFCMVGLVALRFFCAPFLLAQSAPTSTASQAPLSQGTWWLGGSAQFPIEIGFRRPWVIKANLSPEIGHFAFDNILLLFKPLFQTTLFASRQKTGEESIVHWGLQLEGRYFYTLSQNLYLFAGFGAGLEISNWIPDTGILKAEIPLGLFIMVNPSLGISLGAPLSFWFTVRSLFEKAVWTPGYLGIHGLFDF